MAIRVSPFAGAAAAVLFAAAVPASAGSGDRTAPPGTTETRYCMRTEAALGTRIEAVKCWTRAQWAEQGVDVDHDWPREGVRTIG